MATLDMSEHFIIAHMCEISLRELLFRGYFNLLAVILSLSCGVLWRVELTTFGMVFNWLLSLFFHGIKSSMISSCVLSREIQFAVFMVRRMAFIAMHLNLWWEFKENSEVVIIQELKTKQQLQFSEISKPQKSS
jgi:hypothetical protein